jgi:hypothetical protein
MSESRSNQSEWVERSASTNAALGIAAASPFLSAGAAWALSKVGGENQAPSEPPPKIILPPGAGKSDN